MKDPPSFSRLVDLRPVEPSRGPSLVKVNTNSRQCVSRSYPYFPPSLAQSIFVYSFSLSLSIPPVHKSTPPSFFISKLRLSSSLYPSPLSPHLDTILLSSPLLSSPLLFTAPASFRFLAFRPNEELFLLPWFRMHRIHTARSTPLFLHLPPPLFRHRVSRCEINARPVTNVRSAEGENVPPFDVSSFPTRLSVSIIVSP